MKKLWIFLLFLVVLVCFGTPILMLEALKQKVGPLVMVSRKNEKLQEAIKAARKELPAFEGHLKNPAPGERFAIKVGFETSVGPEYLWLKEPDMNAKGFSAVVDQHPVAAPVKMGERIQVRQSDVVDWEVREPNGTTIGGITDQVLAAGQE